jgi:2-dehydropantoate 2-reductase
MRIAVVGAGGVGGWLAARLWSAGADVHVLARGAHLAAIRARGLELVSPAGNVRALVGATDVPAEIGPCDVVLFCVKTYDTRAAAAALPALCHARTIVASLQNGIDGADHLARVVGREHVVGGLALIASTVPEPGVVRHSGGPAQVVFGDLADATEGSAAQLVSACTVPGVDARLSDAIEVALWDKYAFLCALAGTTATVRLPLGEIRACAASWALFDQLVAEVYAVARAVGVAVAADAESRQLAFAEGLEPHIRASLYHDLVAGRRIELDALHGTVVRLGAEHDVPTPASAVVHAILRPHAELARARHPADHPEVLELAQRNLA